MWPGAVAPDVCPVLRQCAKLISRGAAGPSTMLRVQGDVAKNGTIISKKGLLGCTTFILVFVGFH